jgi:cytoskeletal protein RodZ
MPDHRVTDLGARLRRAREARGISLRHIANTTKISVRALEAVERNDLSHLPGGIFTRAFVRAYAAEVGLDPESILREFLSQAPDAHEAIGGADEPAGAASWTERLPLGSVLRVAAVLAVVAAVAYGLARWYGHARSGETGSGAIPDAAAVVAAEPSSATRPAVQQTGGTAERAPDPIAPAAPPGTFTVLVSARAPCWVSARIDGRPPAEQLLAEGARLVLRAEQEVVLKVGDAGAVALEINGRAARLLGGSGRVVTARIGADNLDDYFAGR